MARSVRRRRVRFVPQIEVTECGAASLAMILAYHGHHAPLSELRQACGVSRSGADALAIVTRGAHVRARRAAASASRWSSCRSSRSRPSCTGTSSTSSSWSGSRRPTRVLVDPACGRRIVRLDEMGRHFTGIALQLAPTPSLDAARAHAARASRKYREIFRRSLPSLVQILLASLGLQVVGLLFPVATQILVDSIVVPHQPALALGPRLRARRRRPHEGAPHRSCGASWCRGSGTSSTSPS